jgi:hypothetical protein
VRKLIHVGVAIIGGLVLSLVPTSPAAAIGSETLGCRISPSQTWQYTPERCHTTYASSQYTVSFTVLGGSGSYRYSWRPPVAQIVDGCTATTNSCNVRAYGVGASQSLRATVTITQSGRSRTLSATAHIPANCGSVLC